LTSIEEGYGFSQSAGGAEKKAQLTAWFKMFAPEIPVGVCPSFPMNTATTYPGIDVRIIQIGAGIPDEGFVVNVEMQREDAYDDDGVFKPEARTRMLATFERYRSKPNALQFHCAYCQGITNKSGTALNPEINGTGPEDRGMPIYFDWVKERIGPYRYPPRGAASAGYRRSMRARRFGPGRTSTSQTGWRGFAYRPRRRSAPCWSWPSRGRPGQVTVTV
jgi:hypothetical protein